VTVATILSKMSVLNNELDIASGGADETRAISALDMAQDYLEVVLGNHPDLLGTIGTTTTAANTESTTWPSGLMRIDTMWYLNPSTSRPAWQIEVIQDVGGHVVPSPWPYSASNAVGGTGAPEGCYTNRAHLYWQPLPDAVHTVRINGLYSKDDLTTRAQTFAYPDHVANPLAAFANRLMAMGLGDPSDDLKALAIEMFTPAINMLRQPTRQRPQSRQYSRMHTT
jgi:hypothetical protein